MKPRSTKQASPTDLSEREWNTVAPHVKDKMYLLRPTPGFSSPHLCTLNDLRTVYSLTDLADFHEILDVRDLVAEKAVKAADAARNRVRGRRP